MIVECVEDSRCCCVVTRIWEEVHGFPSVEELQEEAEEEEQEAVL